LWVAFSVVAFLHLLRFPTEIHGAGLDPSWQQCLGYFLTHRFQAGVDYVWTYGPLGYFATQSYNADLFWWKYAWEVLVNLVLAALLTCLGARLESVPLQVGYAVAVLLVPPRWDTYYLAGLIWPVVLVVREQTPQRGVLAALGAWLAVLGLVKFTWLLLASGAWVIVVVACAGNPVRRIEAVVAYPIALTLMWLVLGQSPRNVGLYLAASWQITAGYGEAMASAGDLWRTLLAVLLLVALVALTVARLRSAAWASRPLLGAILIGIGAALVWKHGFTRQPSHDMLFFSFFALAPFASVMLGCTGAPIGAPTIVGTLVIAACALVGRGGVPAPVAWLDTVASNARDFANPLELRRTGHERYEVLAADLARPRFSAKVGTETVDQLSCDQAVVLSNGWNYRPRPVFQSYSAYSPELLADNAAYFASDRAPRFVLWRLAPLDDRIPTSEDGPALFEILRRYRYIDEERGFLLLERRAEPQGEPAGRQVVWEGDVHFDEAISVPNLRGPGLIAYIRIDDTVRGKVTKLFFRPPPLWLHVHTADGRDDRFRLVPALTSAGFLIDPFLRDDTDVVSWYRGHTGPRVESMTVEASPAAKACYGERVHVVVERRVLCENGERE
jgi:hypothetical protein